jgi:hypothetical protein
MLNHMFRPCVHDFHWQGADSDRCSLYDIELRRFYVDMVVLKFSGRSDILWSVMHMYTCSSCLLGPYDREVGSDLILIH